MDGLIKVSSTTTTLPFPGYFSIICTVYSAFLHNSLKNVPLTIYKNLTLFFTLFFLLYVWQNWLISSWEVSPTYCIKQFEEVIKHIRLSIIGTRVRILSSWNKEFASVHLVESNFLNFIEPPSPNRTRRGFCSSTWATNKNWFLSESTSALDWGV